MVKTKRPWFLSKLCFFSLIMGIMLFAIPVLAEDEGIVTGGVVNVRKEPGISSSVAAQVKKGQTLLVLEKEQDWVKVHLHTGVEGWIHSDLVKVILKKVTVVGARANIRRGPNTSYEKIGDVKAGQELLVLAEKSGWYKVELPNIEEAWIAGWLTKGITSTSTSLSGYVIINTDVLKVRKGSSTSYPEITKIGRNEKHTVLDFKDGWYKIKVNDDIEGWVSGDYVRFVAQGIVPDPSIPTESVEQLEIPDAQIPQAVVVTEDIVNIRQWGSDAAPVVDQVIKNDALTVLSNQGDWYQVRLLNGKFGWIANWLVEPLNGTIPSRGGTQEKDVLIVPIAEGKNLKVIDFGGRPKLVLEGWTKNQYMVKQGSNGKTLTLELQGFSTRNYKGKVERVGISEVKVYPQGNKSIVEIAFNFFFASSTKYNASSKETTIQLSTAKGKKLTGKVIVLDPGHASIQPGGWLDPGTVGRWLKLQEKDVNLGIVLKLRNMLEEAGAKVVLTHSGRTGLSLAQRAEVANNINADIFVSIHANANDTPGISGHSTYYLAPAGNATLSSQRYERQKLATLVQREMVATGGRKDGGIIEKNFAVLRETRMPSILVETAYLSDRTEEALLAQDWYRQKLAIGIFNGIVAYFE
ncbi:MAG: N-acetylmuramoyl-L-alanine amidase [Clostridia bacterium]|nr:N-acetylmuramoyl-L-alanine amidase [Clostridia bacterium]MDD4048715.1 N-acetylmuramoyl-L-alanine amidase [Clostridia bacterium]